MAVGDYLREFAHGLTGEVDVNDGVAVDATRVYWGIRSAEQDGGIHVYSLTGTYIGAVVLSNPSGKFINSVQVDDTYIYVLRGNAIQRYDKSTFAYVDNTDITAYVSNPGNMAINNTYIFVADSTNQRVVVFNKSTLAWVANIAPHQPGEYMANVACDDINMYISYHNATSNSIEEYDASTFAYIAAVTSAVQTRSLAVDGTYIYASISNTETKIYNRSDKSFVMTLAYTGNYYGGIAANNGELYLTGISTGPMKIYEGATLTAPLNLTATCTKEAVPEIPGFHFNIISGDF